MTLDDILAAARRAERAWAEQVCEWEALDFGVAYTSAKYPTLAESAQLRDAWIADADPNEIYDRCESHFRDRNLTCRQWTPASGQDVDVVASLLAAKGWLRSDRLALGLVSLQSAIESAPADNPAVRILPARAMRRAYRELIAAESTDDSAAIDAAIDRLDDANFESVIAQIDGRPAGRIAYFEVGDIGCLADFHLHPDFKDSLAAGSLIAHFLHTARRLSPRTIVACIDDTDTAKQAILERHGFAAAGHLPRFLRNAQ